MKYKSKEDTWLRKKYTDIGYLKLQLVFFLIFGIIYLLTLLIN